MNARDTTPFFKYVAQRAMRLGSRVRTLRGTDAKPQVVSMVINGEPRRVWVPGAVVAAAVADLLAPGKLIKLPPKPDKGDRWRRKPVGLIELLPKPLQKKMQQPPPSLWNIPLHRSRLDDPRWRALEAVYQQLVELSPIWEVEGAARVELIDNAIDAALKGYKKATADVGGSKPLKSDKKFFDLERYTETGDAYAREPTREIDQEKRIEEYEAAREQRRHEAEEEFARLVPLLNEYAGKLTLQQRHAWRLIVNEPELTGEAIADASGASTGKVSQLRAWFGEMIAKFLALCEPPEESAAVDVAPTAAADETETQIAEAGEVEAVALDWMASMKAPDTDADVSENVMRGYARSQRSSSAFNRPTRPQYSQHALTTGASWSTRAEMLQAPGPERPNFNKRFSDTAARHLQRKARDSGYDVDGALRLIDEYIEQRIRELGEIAAAEVALFKALFRATVLHDVEDLAWIEPWCEEQKVSPDELLGRRSGDEMLAASIRGPKRGEQ